MLFKSGVNTTQDILSTLEPSHDVALSVPNVHISKMNQLITILTSHCLSHSVPSLNIIRISTVGSTVVARKGREVVAEEEEAAAHLERRLNNTQVALSRIQSKNVFFTEYATYPAAAAVCS